MSRTRVRVLVGGRVQGVFFRDTTRRRAQELGLTGWVRNLPDGRVEAVFEGAEKDVRAAVDFVRRGPPLSDVTHFEVTEETPRGDLDTFSVR